MAKWIKKGVFIDGNFKMVCQGCRDPLATLKEVGYMLSNFPIDNDKPDEYNSYVIDRTFRCNLCGYQEVFGVAVSKEHMEEMVKHEDSKKAVVQTQAAQNYQVG